MIHVTIPKAWTKSVVSVVTGPKQDWKLAGYVPNSASQCLMSKCSFTLILPAPPPTSLFQAGPTLSLELFSAGFSQLWHLQHPWIFEHKSRLHLHGFTQWPLWASIQGTPTHSWPQWLSLAPEGDVMFLTPKSEPPGWSCHITKCGNEKLFATHTIPWGLDAMMGVGCRSSDNINAIGEIWQTFTYF